MNTLFAVMEIYGMSGISRLVRIFVDEGRAEDFAAEQVLRLPPEEQPEYDSYGLCEGHDFVVVEVEFDEEVD